MKDRLKDLNTIDGLIENYIISTVPIKPTCDCKDCSKIAVVDCKTFVNGSWGYLCEEHFKQIGVFATLGCGEGQMIYTAEELESLSVDEIKQQVLSLTEDTLGYFHSVDKEKLENHILSLGDFSTTDSLLIPTGNLPQKVKCDLSVDLSDAQKLLGGYVEVVRLFSLEDGTNVSMFVDEEGLLKSSDNNNYKYLKPNFFNISGNIVIVKTRTTDDGDTIQYSLTKEDLIKVSEILSNNDVYKVK